jgi:hypothetical protein
VACWAQPPRRDDADDRMNDAIGFGVLGKLRARFRLAMISYGAVSRWSRSANPRHSDTLVSSVEQTPGIRVRRKATTALVREVAPQLLAPSEIDRRKFSRERNLLRYGSP